MISSFELVVESSWVELEAVKLFVVLANLAQHPVPCMKGRKMRMEMACA